MRDFKRVPTGSIVAGVLRGVQKVTGKDYATATLQHVTTAEECEQWIQVVKAMYTDNAGKLDKKGYCKALNSARDSMLFTIKELRNAIKDARRSGNTAAIPGYETIIEQYQSVERRILSGTSDTVIEDVAA